MKDTPGLLPLARYDLIKKQASKPSTVTSPRWTSILKWWPEAVGWIASVLIVAAIVVVLHAYNGVATARWQSQMPVTLNAFLSLLVTFLYMALMIPIPKCIAQLKWNHYTTARPLSDVEIFDEASRTVWGSAVLLGTRPKRLLAALGAFLTLAVAGVGPFVQQILSQEVVPRQIDEVTPTVPILNWTSSYSGDQIMAFPHPSDGSFDTEDPGTNSDLFDDAFYSGIIAPATRDFPVTPNCASANCTWEPYWTFVVESECRNISDQAKPTATNSSGSWIFPNNMPVVKGFGLTYNISTRYPSVAFQDRGHLLSDFFITTVSDGSPKVIECILQLRARKVQAKYENGHWSETQIGPSLSNNSLEARGCSPWRRSLAGYYFETPVISDPTGITYPNASGLDPLFSLWYPNSDIADSLGLWSLTCNVTIATDSASAPNLIFPAVHLKTMVTRLHYLLGLDTQEENIENGDKTGGILNKLISLLVPADPDAGGYFVIRPNNITIPERVDNIAKSLTQGLRASVFSDRIYASGDAYKDTVVYKVAWYWTVVPASLVLLTLLLLVLTAWDTIHKGLQKRTDSSLALIVFGCDERVRKTLAAAGDLDAITKFAKGQYVRLGSDHVLTAAEGSQKCSKLTQEWRNDGRTI